MQFDQPSQMPVRDIEVAIDREPLIVKPNTSLMEVIDLMIQNQSNSCCVLNEPLEVSSVNAIPKSRSYALVMQDENLLGIFTERDIVKLAADELNLEQLTVGQVMTQQVITLPLNALCDVFGPLFLFRRYGIRHLPVIGDGGEVVGVVSSESIRQIVRPIDFLKIRRVAEVMTTPVISLPMTASVSIVAKLMAQHRVSCVVITQDIETDGEMRSYPVGIITERDIVQYKVIRLNMTETSAGEVMSTPLFLLQPEDTLLTAYQEMQNRRVRRLVVTWDWGKEIGIVTQTSLLRCLDPIEIYGVEEALEKTANNGEVQKIKQILKQRVENQYEFESALSNVLNNLETLLTQTPSNNIGHSQQSGLKSTARSVEQLQELLRILKRDTQNLESMTQDDIPQEENLHQNQTSVECGPDDILTSTESQRRWEC